MRARDCLRAHQSSIQRRSRIVSEAEFAQIPISEPVATGRALAPASAGHLHLRLERTAGAEARAGLYLLEATDGRFKAYTLLMVTDMALVTRTTSGNVSGLCRRSRLRQPVAGAKVDAGFGQSARDSATTDADGLAQLQVAGDKSAAGQLLGGGRQGRRVCRLHAVELGADLVGQRPICRLRLHRAARLPPGAHRALEGDSARAQGQTLALPKPGTVHVVIADENDKAVFDKQMPLSAVGDVSGDFDLPEDCGAWLLLHPRCATASTQTTMTRSGRRLPRGGLPQAGVPGAGDGPPKRVLEGATMPVTIDSRYFFGEPVANAAVKYRVYQAPHYWWGEEGGDPTKTPAWTRTATTASTGLRRRTSRPRRPASWTRTASSSIRCRRTSPRRAHPHPIRLHRGGRRHRCGQSRDHRAGPLPGDLRHLPREC